MIHDIRRYFGLILTVCVLLGGAVRAGDNPVVVELFTSQGCSSCPPADRLLHKLAERDDVIALALHVDYWDYIGWKDQFANPAHSERQRNYARVAGRRSVYTPQMIVNGMDSIVGARGMELADTIQAHKSRQTGVSVSVTRQGQQVAILARRPAGGENMVVHLLRYMPRRAVDITRGENAGRMLEYANIVKDWQILGAWSGGGDLSMTVAAPGDDPVVVLVQADRHGPILAAGRLR